MQIKRSISVILTAVLLCMAILMTSCDALSVKKVEEDPTEQLMSSTSSTATNVVNSISPLDPVKAALKKVFSRSPTQTMRSEIFRTDST